MNKQKKRYSQPGSLTILKTNYKIKKEGHTDSGKRDLSKMNKILIVDRETQFILKSIETLIDKYQLFVAYSKMEAIKTVKNEFPDLVIIGYLEPFEDANKLEKKLRSDVDTKHIPIIIIGKKTRNILRQDWRMIDGTQTVADGYLSRPIEPEKLKTEVKRTIAAANRKNVELVEAFSMTETLLLNQVENWKKKMIQMIGTNRVSEL